MQIGRPMSLTPLKAKEVRFVSLFRILDLFIYLVFQRE